MPAVAGRVVVLVLSQLNRSAVLAGKNEIFRVCHSTLTSSAYFKCVPSRRGLQAMRPKMKVLPVGLGVRAEQLSNLGANRVPQESPVNHEFNAKASEATRHLGRNLIGVRDDGG